MVTPCPRQMWCSGSHLDFLLIILFSEYIYLGSCSVVEPPKDKVEAAAHRMCRDGGLFEGWPTVLQEEKKDKFPLIWLH